MQAQNARARTLFGPVQIGTILLTLVTALIHLYLNVLMGEFSVMFTLNALGYLALLAAIFLPLPVIKNYRPAMRMLFLGYTLLTIILWAIMGSREMIAYVDKLAEVGLVILLWLDRARG